MFVCALKKVAERCLCLAIYLLQERGVLDNEATEDSVELDAASDIFEMIGVSIYTSLMGSQNYGYPMHVMTDQRKRRLANASKVCFLRAVDTSGNPGEKAKGVKPETWDLLLMIGKVRTAVFVSSFFSHRI